MAIIKINAIIFNGTLLEKVCLCLLHLGSANCNHKQDVIVIHFYWHTDTFLHLHIVYGSLHLNSRVKNPRFRTYKAPNNITFFPRKVYKLLLYRIIKFNPTTLRSVFLSSSSTKGKTGLRKRCHIANKRGYRGSKPTSLAP